MIVILSSFKQQFVFVNLDVIMIFIEALKQRIDYDQNFFLLLYSAGPLLDLPKGATCRNKIDY